MSTSENSPLSHEAAADQLTSVRPLQAVAPLPAAGWLAGGGAVPAAAGPQLAALLAALRRRWLSVAAVGLLSAAVLGPLTWFAIGPQYTANAQLLLDPTRTQGVFRLAEDQNAANGPQQFEIFKETQQDLLLSPFVLAAALRDDSVKGLPIVRKQDEKHNAVTWLGGALRVGSQRRNTAVLQVSLKRPTPEEAAALVNAVVRAYWTEVVEKEQVDRQQRLNQLQNLYSEKETEARDRREKIKNAAERLGTSETEVASLRQQMAVQQYSDYRRESDRIRFELGKTRGQLAAQRDLQQQVKTVEIAEAEVLVLAAPDPLYKSLVERQMYMSMLYSQVERTAIIGRVKSADKFKDDVGIVTEQLKQLSENYREKIRQMRALAIQNEIRKLETEVAVLTEQAEQFQKDVEHERKEAEQLGRSSTEIEMQRAELKHLDQIFAQIADERDRLQVEQRWSTGRVRIVGNPKAPADLPENQSNWMLRMVLTLAGMLAGLCLPGVAIVLWDVRLERVNDSQEVGSKLGLPVLGTVPRIPAGVLRRLGSPSRRNQAWRMRLTEAVDGLAARLLRKAETEDFRVILVTSASAGEGKTTLATQLAMSLARHQRRTVLVDFDLRRPALDGIFGLSVEPGVCEILRSRGAVPPVARPTAVDHLSVVTAGRWDRQTLAALANGAARTLLDELRAEYDFVVIDSSPILPVADTRLVSQHVDTVVLSVFLDVSRGPKVLAAYEILEAFGVQSVEAVVTGGDELFYGKDTGYASAGPAGRESPDTTPEPDDSEPSAAAE
jgi:capsular exopolysaccharide synthesis family protein